MFIICHLERASQVELPGPKKLLDEQVEKAIEAMGPGPYKLVNVSTGEKIHFVVPEESEEDEADENDEASEASEAQADYDRWGHSGRRLGPPWLGQLGSRMELWLEPPRLWLEPPLVIIGNKQP